MPARRHPSRAAVTWVTGLRSRFFYTLLVVTLVAVAAVSALTFRFFTSERDRLIDEKVELMASSLISANLSEVVLEKVDDTLSNALRTDAATALVTILKPDGSQIFRNAHARSLLGDAQIPLEPSWVHFDAKGHHARIANIRLKGESRVLQIGLLLDRNDLRWHTLNVRWGAYVLIMLTVAALAAWVLSSLLLRPLVSAASSVSHLSANIGSPNRASLSRILLTGRRASKPHDPFSRLVRAVDDFAGRIENRFHLQQASERQMTHEMRTPLAVIRTILESLASTEKDAQRNSSLSEALAEVDRLNRVVSDFLAWSHEDSALPGQGRLEAIDLNAFLLAAATRVQKATKKDIRLDLGEEQKIFGDATLAEQLFVNLLDNAAKYGTDGHSIHVESGPGWVRITNTGSPISNEVLARLGQPFNVGYGSGRRQGTGLGLAWVMTICRKHGWRVTMSAIEQGTQALIEFSDA